ncbi:MotA/TolQ/ExbB proton channel family protein [Oceanimonas sp. NS1]|nr:MotA/TolQ/ExbB proton channel family protein [Oceanimonas sp. NS1]
MDGTEPAMMEQLLDNELTRIEEQKELEARVFEAMGGYSPTIGIIGAVLGLIQAMSHLDDPARLGSGIAVAFVATLYGGAGQPAAVAAGQPAPGHLPAGAALSGADRHRPAGHCPGRRQPVGESSAQSVSGRPSMKRRSLLPAHQDQHTERWLVSYADYMTLAFALFVMLYAVHASRSELRQPVVEGVQQALGQLGAHPTREGAMTLQGQPALPVSELPAATSSANSLHRLSVGLGERLAPLLDKELASVELGEQELVLTLDGSLLFSQGSALLGPNSEALFSALSPLLNQHLNYLRVRGFTDNVAVSNELYASNWQLSAERARAVLERLEQDGVAPARLVLEAYGRNRPRAEGGARPAGHPTDGWKSRSPAGAGRP